MSNAINDSFVSFQKDYWDGPWQSRQGFLTALSQRAKVLFSSPPLHVEDVLRSGSRRRTAMTGLQQIDQSLWSFVPTRALPVNHRLPAVERVFRRIRGWQLRRVCSRLHFLNPATIVFHPHAVQFDLENAPRPLIYYKYDHYAGYGRVPAERQRFLDDSERRLFDKADLVLVTGAGLFDLHRHDAQGRIHLLPNGVDYPAFAGVTAPDFTVPHDLGAIPSPRLGYIGQINEKVDFRLLRQLAARRRQFSIVLVGSYRSASEAGDAQFQSLLGEPNVYFLGPKAHREIPGYLAGLDVGLMPYVLTEWVRFGYPLKLHEYLAAGLPSVASELRELEPFRSVVTIAASVDEWVAAVDAGVVSRHDPLGMEHRRAVAKANSWNVRVEDFLQLVDTTRIQGLGH